MNPSREPVVLVTGGSSGLGRALAEEYLRAGARVIVLSRNTDRLQSTVTSLRAPHRDIRAIQADITVPADVERMAREVVQMHGGLDILANVAGKSMRGRAEETTPEQHRELWELNFLAAVRCTLATLPLLHESRGSIINVGSLSSKIATPFLGAYPASKFPLAAYSQQLRLELAPAVHVLLVCPGPIARSDGGRRYDEQRGNLPGGAEQPAGGARVRAISPELLAQRIRRACERRQPELIVPARAKLLFALAQLAPQWGDWIIRRLTPSSAVQPDP